MSINCIAEGIGAINNLAEDRHEPLHVVVVYQDTPTLKWAKQVCRSLEVAAGSRLVRCTWWNLAELTQAAVFAGAVSTAMRSEVVVAALPAMDRPPLSLCLWVNAWMQHRRAPGGALIGLVRLSAKGPRVNGTQNYLRSVAREGGLNLLMEERRAVNGTAHHRMPARV
jgi:hypothetical protein